MKYSVIIPAYNAERTIGICINSVLNQSLRARNKEYETILVDDGSTDNTALIAERYGVRVVRQKCGGPAKARNIGAEHANGDILIFTDADCELDYMFLEKITAPFECDPEVVGVQGSYRTKQEEFVSRFAQIEIETRYRKMSKSDCTDFIGTYAAAYVKDIFQKFNGFDTSFPHASGEDADLSYKLHKNGYKMVFEKEAFVYHQHPSTLRKYLKSKFYRGFWRAKLYRKHPYKTVTDSYTPQPLKFQVLGCPIFFFCILSSFVNHGMLLAVGFTFIPYVLFSFPFLSIYGERNYSGRSFIPLMLFLRANALFIGLVSGVINELLSIQAKCIAGAES